MKRHLRLVLPALFVIASTAAFALKNTPSLTGEYLEVRSCDVYTGPCFANGEMGLAGKEGILVWNVREGRYMGTDLRGLSVIAVVKTDATLGDQRFQPRSGEAILIIDAKATAQQRDALVQLARSMAGDLVREVVAVNTAPMAISIGSCDQSGCAKVKAGSLVEISTRCLGGNDHHCGNEETFYPPLTAVIDAHPAFTEVASFQGTGLGVKWESTGQRSAFLGTFSR